MKVSIAITVLNEERTIVGLLESIFHQTKKPDEVVIVDGGSTDRTVSLIKEFQRRYDKGEVIQLIVEKNSNRAKGRNLAIERATFEIVALTDAGCILDPNWLFEITKPFKDPRVEIVSGYYKDRARSVFEKCVAAYVFVMPDRVDVKKFLPSSRSMAMRKSLFRETGGFPKEYPLNEDYVFNLRLKKLNKQFFFNKKAICYWLPRENIRESFSMFYRFAKGDSQARIFRPKVLLIFLRYLFGLLFLLLSLMNSLFLPLLAIGLLSYTIWSILKNYRYVKDVRALLYLPLLQFTSDIAAMAGTSSGLLANFPLAVFTNTAYQVIGKIVVTSLGLLTTILLTRYLGVHGFGQFALIFAYFALVSTVADFGLGTLLTRELAKGEERTDYIGTVFTLRIIISTVVHALFVIASFFLPYPQMVKSGIIIYSLGSFFSLLYNLYFSVFQAELQLQKHLIAQSVGSLVSLLLVLLFIKLNLSFAFIIVAQVLANMTMFLTGFAMLGKSMRLVLNLPVALVILRQALPLLFSSMLAVVYFRVDFLILSFFKDPNIFPDVGIYAASYRIFEILIVFGTFFTNALFPVFVREVKSPAFLKIFRDSLSVSFLLALVGLFSLLFLAKYVVLIVAGEKFLASVLPLQILSVALALSLFLNTYYALIVAKDQQKYAVVVGIVAALFNIFANILFIPTFSYLASSLITVATSLIILISYMFIVERSLRI